MIGGKAQSGYRPSAIGLTMQSAVYGSTIPVIFGRIKGAMYLIWAENLRKHSSSKKLLKKGQPTWAENVDFLIGQNPINGVLQMWQDNNTKLPLNFVKTSLAGTGFGPAPGDSGTYTIADSNFYWILAVTASANYSFTFNDYGSIGSQTLSGNYEIPLWNVYQNGPNPTYPHPIRRWPYLFAWAPGGGASIYVPQRFSGVTALNIYYAQLDPTGSKTYSKKNAGTAVPCAALKLTFEPQLGDGPEYGSAYAAQQVIMPQFAGLGSDQLDLGSSNMIPNIRPEILGSYAFRPYGDVDFMDMVEHIFAALPQAAYGSSENLSTLQNGLSCFDFPGVIQAQRRESAYTVNSLRYYMPNKAGNYLIALFSASQLTGTFTGFVDDAGDSFTTSASYTFGAGLSALYTYFGYAPASNHSANRVYAGGISGDYSSGMTILEVAGVDALDTSVSNTGSSGTPNATITVAPEPGTRELLVALCARQSGNYNPTNPDISLWKTIASGGFGIYTRIVTQPGTYTFTSPGGTSGSWGVNILAFKLGNAANFGLGAGSQSISWPLGNIIDYTTMNQARAQCAAFGLWGSMIMDSQRKASDWLDDILTAANVAPVWSGFKLKLIPRSEASYAGNGAQYTSPTSAGPVANFSDVNGDFVENGDNPLIKITRKAQVDAPNVQQLQFPYRDGNYNPLIISYPESSMMALYGARKENPKLLPCVVDPVVARSVLGIKIRRDNYYRNEYTFRINARGSLLEAMDLITVTDSLQGINLRPVRLLEVKETDGNFDCNAEDFFYGCSSPVALAVTTASPYAPATGADPGVVNTPIIFEPVARLTNGAQQLWLIVSGSVAAYAGCQVYMSTDGGSSYGMIGTISGNAITGVTSADWPAASDPDTTNDLGVDLTESLGSLISYQVSDEDNFTYPCYVAGGTSAIPYELMAYAVATLTATYKYTLKATGGGTNKLRRAVFGAPQVGLGVDHPLGSRFAFIPLDGTGILKLDMDPKWIGKTLHFKFVAFNTMLGGQGDYASMTDYTYVPTGVASAVNPGTYNYAQSPVVALSQPSSTQIDMAQVTVQFPNGSVNYNARTFTIPDPGATPTMYYVTIADPNQIGDTGAGTTLTAYCETTQSKVGLAGYTYIGSLFAITGGGGTGGSGGYPPQQLFLVNGA